MDKDKKCKEVMLNAQNRVKRHRNNLIYKGLLVDNPVGAKQVMQQLDFNNFEQRTIGDACKMCQQIMDLNENANNVIMLKVGDNIFDIFSKHGMNVELVAGEKLCILGNGDVIGYRE